MRFKNKKTGKIHSSMYDAYVEHCESRICSSDCAMHKIEGTCEDYVNAYPMEAANLLGYEIIQDDNTEPKITEDKQIEDWTIRELMEYCRNIGKCDNSCIFYNEFYISKCNLYDIPARWDFNLKQKYTDDEIKNAKQIRELLPSVMRICRDDIGMVCYELANHTTIHAPSFLFPSIKPNSSIPIDDIIESEND